MDSVSGITSASKIQMDYMKLLVEQLKNQNPLEPLDNNEMALQLAQFSQLQQLEDMNGKLGSTNYNFEKVLEAANRSYANSLIGKTITFLTENDEGNLVEMTGNVKEVFNDPEKGSVLILDVEGEVDYTVGVDGVVAVKEQE
jgi:flagellar basal-body rod modification protein FlgD